MHSAARKSENIKEKTDASVKRRSQYTAGSESAIDHQSCRFVMGREKPALAIEFQLLLAVGQRGKPAVFAHRNHQRHRQQQAKREQVRDSNAVARRFPPADAEPRHGRSH